MPYSKLACDHNNIKGRFHKEEYYPDNRTPFEKDRDRILHSNAFRSLQYKTQVFHWGVDNNSRNRLTHSIEVAQIARSIAVALNVDSNLSEAIALAHDIGHTPFGHAGEHALQACMKNFDDFDHNSQVIRILVDLEDKYIDFKGLNLTWEVLAGIVKHNGPINNPSSLIQHYNKKYNFLLSEHASIEAQIAAIADDIAYNAHDMEDGLRNRLFTIDNLQQINFIKKYITQLYKKNKNINENNLFFYISRNIIYQFIQDLVATTNNNIQKYQCQTHTDIVNNNIAIVSLSDQMHEINLQIKEFLYKNMYKHSFINGFTFKANNIITQLFNAFIQNLDLLPSYWYKQCCIHDQKINARVIADYIVSMNDISITKEYQRLFNNNINL